MQMSNRITEIWTKFWSISDNLNIVYFMNAKERKLSMLLLIRIISIWPLSRWININCSFSLVLLGKKGFMLEKISGISGSVRMLGFWLTSPFILIFGPLSPKDRKDSLWLRKMEMFNIVRCLKVVRSWRPQELEIHSLALFALSS